MGEIADIYVPSVLHSTSTKLTSVLVHYCWKCYVSDDLKR